MGWASTGIDIDPELIAAGRRQLQADLRCVPLMESGFADGHFDFIRLRDVIEHLPNPYESLCEIRRILAPDGVVFFATPNEGSMAGAVKALLGRGGRTVATVTPPHHLHGFTPETLRRILGRAGFRTLAVKTTTPVDPRYVTSNNMRSAGSLPHRLFWAASRAVGRGSMLVSWVQKDGAAATS